MQYFYADADGSSQRGPVDLEGLRALRLGRETLVWREGLAEWQPAGALPELAPLFQVPPGPSPSVVHRAAPATPPHAQSTAAAQPFAPSSADMSQPAYMPQHGYPPAWFAPGQGPAAHGPTPYAQLEYGNLNASTPGQGLSIASMVLGIVAIPSTFCYGAGFLFALLAVIFGHIGHSQSRRQTGRANGMAVAGLVCGYISLAVVAFVFIFFMLLLGSLAGGGRGGF